MSTERYHHIIDEVYGNYLKNFTPKQCPPNIDVQPRYYEPMTKEWFILSLKEKNDRGREFSKRWGLKIEERELSLEERVNLLNDSGLIPTSKLMQSIVEPILSEHNIPSKQITFQYNGEKIEVYE
jgi:hypothetical protein